MGILNTDLNHINLDDTSHNEDDREIIIHIRLDILNLKNT